MNADQSQQAHQRSSSNANLVAETKSIIKAEHGTTAISTSDEQNQRERAPTEMKEHKSTPCSNNGKTTAAETKNVVDASSEGTITTVDAEGGGCDDVDSTVADNSNNEQLEMIHERSTILGSKSIKDAIADQ
mmetsp:Transcript_19780/g.27843  ORF Transcript_19780/g.27843 Transcript_19780/m.27843 type:complete len:132 (+) Transcript_19780:131-526(+)